MEEKLEGRGEIEFDSASRMRIAICEDNQEHAEILKKMIKQWAVHEHVHVDSVHFLSAEQLLFSADENVHYDMAFLDIQLKNMNGLQLAHLLRDQDKTMVLVFTTGEQEYILKGYEVSAFRYLLKPLRNLEVADTLTKANELLTSGKRDAVIIPCRDGYKRILKNDIYYVEVDNHHIKVHLQDEEYRFNAQLRDLGEQFQEPQFCKCHRSYIINFSYVTKMTKECVQIENGVELPVSRNRWNDMNRCYLAYYAPGQESVWRK